MVKSTTVSQLQARDIVITMCRKSASSHFSGWSNYSFENMFKSRNLSNASCLFCRKKIYLQTIITKLQGEIFPYKYCETMFISVRSEKAQVHFVSQTADKLRTNRRTEIHLYITYKVSFSNVSLTARRYKRNTKNQMRNIFLNSTLL